MQYVESILGVRSLTHSKAMKWITIHSRIAGINWAEKIVTQGFAHGTFCQMKMKQESSNCMVYEYIRHATRKLLPSQTLLP